MTSNFQERVLTLNSSLNQGESVLYIMSRDQRVHDNHALLYAQERALELGLELVVGFVGEYAQERRAGEFYDFMYDGLERVAKNLQQLNIGLMSVCNEYQEGYRYFVKNIKPKLVVFDFSPLSGVRLRQKEFAKNFDGEVVVVDTHNVVPVWQASQKQEYAAVTFRRRFHDKFATYLQEPKKISTQAVSAKVAAPENNVSLLLQTRKQALQSAVYQNIDHGFLPGEKAAKKHLKEFIHRRLDNYAIDRNKPDQDAVSGLSPYLHFGQISSLRVALDIIREVGIEPLLLHESKMAQAGENASSEDGMNALFEEMLVRKELSDNFCFYSKAGYKDVKAAASWAQQTLAKHADDPREFLYTFEDWRDAKTHDNAWNAAQRQLLKTGKIHGYMRMYWAKKVLEWSSSPQEALDILIRLNDAYSIDGLDPNGYVGILWSVAGLHDRPWFERPVYGTVRYMNYMGLKRKFDIDSYIAKWTS